MNMIDEPIDFTNILSSVPNNFNPIQISNLNMINENYALATENIPELLDFGNLIFLNGKLSNYPVNIMIDTGASMCTINKSIIDSCNLNYLIDTQSNINISGAHSIASSVGTLWYVELEIELSNGNYANLPINAHIIDDSAHIKQNNEISKQFDKLNEEYLNLKFIIDNFTDIQINMKHFKDIEEKIKLFHDNKKKTNIDIILGINFLKSYKANINFSKSIITLNDSIDMKFK